MVKIESTVEPKVKATAFSVSPLKLSEKVEASPAVGIPNAINTPTIISVSTKPPVKIDFATKSSATITTGNTTSFNAET